MRRARRGEAKTPSLLWSVYIRLTFYRGHDVVVVLVVVTRAISAMDSSANLNDLLECPVCLDTLGPEHKVLPCQHTFCTRCLLDVRDKRARTTTCSSSSPPVRPMTGDGDVEIICPECRLRQTQPIISESLLKCFVRPLIWIKGLIFHFKVKKSRKYHKSE